jgi:threonylcarbamoyladenosine tRNA methylthiotransferase MtaB
MSDATAKSSSSPAPDVISLGCRLNGYESEKMAVLAGKAGLDNAVIINTCAVTNEAVRQARQTIRKTARTTGQKVIVTGCAAQIDPAAFQAMPEVDAVIGNGDKLDARTWQNLRSGPASPVRDIMAETQIGSTVPLATTERARAYVQVQNGCDHRCTFCIIPYGRGNSRSVPVQDVIGEIRSLVDNGTKEVVLTGVDITSYGPDLPGNPSLGLLVRRILTDVPALPRLRLSSIDGVEIDEELFQVITEDARIAPYLHLSLQAGDNMILKRMKRRHTREQAIEFCARIRAKRPEVLFGADIIAGFPTETEEMFARSLALVDDCDLTWLHVFPYSAREGTPAARMPQLDGTVIKERAARLRAKGDDALAKHLNALVGQQATILTEKAGKDGIGRGRMANFAEVQFDLTANPALATPGHFAKVRLTGTGQRSLQGEIISSEDQQA